jgi:hypothetical protein
MHPEAAQELGLPFWNGVNISQTRLRVEVHRYDDDGSCKKSIEYKESPILFKANKWSYFSPSLFKDMITYNWYADKVTDKMGWKAYTWNEKFEHLWQFFMGEAKKRGRLVDVDVHPYMMDLFIGGNFKHIKSNLNLIGWRPCGPNDECFALWRNDRLDENEILFSCAAGNKLSKFRVRIL